MVVHRDTGKIEHKQFKDILNIFGDGDTFIFNNTKVFRPHGVWKEKTELRYSYYESSTTMPGCLWDVLVDPARVKQGR